MKKYMQALARHERAKQKVENLTRRICAAIERCPVVVKSNDWSLSNAERAEIWDEKTGKHKTHLWRAYTETTCCESGYGMRMLDPGEQEEMLQPANGGCRHCLRAWRLIIDRKAARAELGYAKLAIRALGKQALKESGDE